MLTPLIGALVAVLGLDVVGVYVARRILRTRHIRREEQLTRRAADRSLERGLAKVRGEEWVQQHRHS